MSIPVFGCAPPLSCAHDAIHQHGHEVVEMRHVGSLSQASQAAPPPSGCDAKVTVRTTHTFPGIRLQPAG